MIELFHSKTYYNKYLHYKKYTDKINRLRSKGYLVYDDNVDIIDSDFIYKNGEILLPISMNCKICLIGDVTSDFGIYVENTKKQIDNYFKKFKVVDPKFIKNLNTIE